MRNSIVILGFVLWSSFTLAQNTLGQKKVFGVSLRWESESKEVDQALTKKIEQYQSEFAESMDPDCRWRKPVNGVCPNRFPEQTKELEKIAEVIKKETQGVYEILHKGKDGMVRRDFDGLSQGFFINKLKGEIKFPFLADFAGDIFVHPLIKPSKNLIVGDPLIEAVTYATVDMPGGGWMIASAGRALGAKLRNPNQPDVGDAPKEDFQKIVVFAEPSFDGARVDAWATAIVAGGKPVLEHLWTLKEYEGKWGYFGLTSDSKPVWSSNLKFRDQDGVRTVTVPNWK